MARRRRRGFGAVTGRKQGRTGRVRSFDVRVSVQREAGFYIGTACPRWGEGGGRPGRCGTGVGKNASSATGNALRAMANILNKAGTL